MKRSGDGSTSPDQKKEDNFSTRAIQLWNDACNFMSYDLRGRVSVRISELEDAVKKNMSPRDVAELVRQRKFGNVAEKALVHRWKKIAKLISKRSKKSKRNK